MESPNDLTMLNITEYTPSNLNTMWVQAVAESGGIEGILSCLVKTPFVAVRKECIWTLSNIAVGSGERVRRLAEAGEFKNEHETSE